MTKKRNKILGLTLALSLSLGSFAGLAVTANAEGEPAYDAWNFNTPTYSEDFSGDEWNIDFTTATQAGSPKVITNGNWTFSKFATAQAAVDTRWVKIENQSLKLSYQNTAILGTVPSSDYIYFAYTLTGRTNNVSVVLEGVTNGSLNIPANTEETASTYTNVIDISNTVAYTYKGNEYIGKTDFEGSSVTGIRFRGPDSSAWTAVDNVLCGTATMKENPAYSTYSGKLQTLYNINTAILSNAEVSDKLQAFDDSSSWSIAYPGQEITFKSNNNAVILDGSGLLRLAYKNRYVQYSNTSEGSYFYVYKIRTWNTTAGNQFVKLVGSSEYTLVSNEAADSTADTKYKEYNYITVIDKETREAYTYNYNGTSVGTPIDLSGETDDVAIKFTETADGTYQIVDFSYGIIAEPEVAATAVASFTTGSASTSGSLAVTPEEAIDSIQVYVGDKLIMNYAPASGIAAGKTINFGILVNDTSVTISDLKISIDDGSKRAVTQKQ